MDDRAFLDILYKWAASLKQEPLTAEEKKSIVAKFNLARGSNIERAQEAVYAVIRMHLTEDILSKSANLDNTQRLLSDLRRAASEWKPSSKK